MAPELLKQGYQFSQKLTIDRKKVRATVVHFVAGACTFAKYSNNLGDEASSLYLIVPFQDVRIGTASVREPMNSNNTMTPPSLD